MAIPHTLGPTLELIRGGQSAQVYELKGTELYVGRVPGLDVYLDDARVSRRHARIEQQTDGRYYIVDLDSKGYTLLDGRRLKAFQPALLRNGSRIKIVDFELVFHDHAVELDETLEHDSTILESIDNLTTDHLARRSVEPAEALKAILEINQALGGGAEFNEMLGRALDGLMAVFPAAERGFILVAGPEGKPRLRALRQRTGTARLPVLSRSILRQVMEEGKAVLIQDSAVDPRFLRARSVVSTFKTALCVPLSGRDGRPLGMVQIDRMKGRKGFRPGDLDLLAALAVPVGVAIENDRLLKERAWFAAAREIQLSLLPRCRPEIPGYAFWDCYAPTLEVGGDLYDYIAVERTGKAGGEPGLSRWAVVVGDVAGKGMPAALVVAGICPEVRHLARAGVEPAEVLSQVNRNFCDREVGGRFVTMALVFIDPESHVLTVVNAGHADPLVRRASGAVEPVERSGAGPPLGVTPRAVYKPVSVALAPGDLVVLYTDGVTDSMDRDRQPFGIERLKQATSAAPKGPAAVGEAILAAVQEHAAGRSQYDDITIVCFERERG
jgi:serine phosphatase RsbU (regulator of sigma subunit)/pSer/pThr/pTyr-binding forkhead associated (FHA) protein